MRMLIKLNLEKNKYFGYYEVIRVYKYDIKSKNFEEIKVGNANECLRTKVSSKGNILVANCEIWNLNNNKLI